MFSTCSVGCLFILGPVVGKWDAKPICYCSFGVIMCFFGARNSLHAFGLCGEGCYKK